MDPAQTVIQIFLKTSQEDLFLARKMEIKTLLRDTGSCC